MLCGLVLLGVGALVWSTYLSLTNPSIMQRATPCLTTEDLQYGLTSNPYPSYGMPPSTTLCVESMSHLKSSTPMKNPDAVAESQ